ncbi:alpha-ketoglutarate-dependent dioxygenase AlkB family protein [Tepidamorphus sp. 3E244]|uniref:alpha-ketoglutarate-dependent dioxygenase AlkB family protein n=1 Tax=Tepidamorphus sp. 3E244 TaxID=3385498 RepID=UPI0038FC1C16
MTEQSPTRAADLEPVPGLRLYSLYFNPQQQAELRDAIRDVVRQAPLYTPVMPRSGRPFSVRMTNCGPLGWVADKAGYRYQPTHPETGEPWPAMPPQLTALWENVAGFGAPPEACLVNHYAESARMGLHVDEDEQDFDAPVVSVSLGDSCLFRYGGLARRDPTRSFRLHSGDVLVMGGPARLIHHGVDRIIKDTSTLLTQSGRINLTLRRVTKPGLNA